GQLFGSETGDRRWKKKARDLAGAGSRTTEDLRYSSVFFFAGFLAAGFLLPSALGVLAALGAASTLAALPPFAGASALGSGAFSARSTSSMIEIGAASPWRLRSFMTRV